MKGHIDDLDRNPVAFSLQIIFFGFILFHAVCHTLRNRIADFIVNVDLIAGKISDNLFPIRQPNRQIVPRHRVEIRHNRFERVKKFFRSHNSVPPLYCEV